MKHIYKTKGVCSSEITFELEGEKVKNINFVGGCNGNLKAISKLCEGLTVFEIENKLKGNICGFKNTSCVDQLAIAVKSAYDIENKKSV